MKELKLLVKTPYISFFKAQVYNTLITQSTKKLLG